MTPTALQDFGYQVKNARIREKLTLESLALRALDNGARKGYLSQVEQGKRPLSAMTIGRLATALNLPESVTEPLLRAGPPEVDAISADDRNAERLITLTAKDHAGPQPAEALLIALAYEFAPGSTGDLISARNGLRAALEAAAEMKARGQLPQNTDGQLQAVLAEVARLNDLGEFDQAAEALDEEMQRAEAAHEAIYNRQLDQDRIMNRPEVAAKRIIAHIERSFPAVLVWRATRDLVNRWREMGEIRSQPFELWVSLHLAKANLSYAKGPQKGASLSDLGNSQFSLGKRIVGDKLILAAKVSFEAAQRSYLRKSDPQNWSISQTNLGNTLRILGEIRSDPALLRRAVKSHEAALIIDTKAANPDGWATSQLNLGAALKCLGEATADLTLVNKGISAYHAALTVYVPTAFPHCWAKIQKGLAMAHMTVAELTKDATKLDIAAAAFEAALTEQPSETVPYLWADGRGGLGRVALLRFDLTGDKAQLTIAARYLTEARAVFALDPENRFARECDDLLAQIDAKMKL